MADAENTLPPTKKRAAGREISRDNPGLDDDEETSEQETGTFKKASDEVLASRRIVKVRRPPPSSTPSSNPFAGIQLIPSAVPKSATPESTEKLEIEKKVPVMVDGNNNAEVESGESKGVVAEPIANIETKTVAKEETAEPIESKADVEAKTVAKEEIANEASKSDLVGETSTEVEKAEVEKSTEVKKAEIDDKKVVEEPAEDKGKKDSTNESIEKSQETASFSSFQQLSSSQNAFTGIVGTGFSSSTFSFGVSKDGSSASCDSGFSFNFSNNNGSSLNKTEKAGFPSMQEVSVETGEENEKAVFTADSVLFEFLEGGWKERGKGEIRVNIPTSGSGKARLVMRTRGNYRLVLNASLYPDMKLANMDKKGITFACINSGGEGKEGLSTFALKFKDVALVEEFRSVVDKHKEKTSAVLRTPENSPKASDE